MTPNSGFPWMAMRDYVSSSIKILSEQPAFPFDWFDLLLEWETNLCKKEPLLWDDDYFKEKREETLLLAKQVAVAVAGLSFYPGGIDYLDIHYESHFGGKCEQKTLAKEANSAN